MIVTVPGSSGDTNAYTSVLSATGSLLIAGASRWDDISSGSLLRRAGDPGGDLAIVQLHLALTRHHRDLSGVGLADVGHDGSRCGCRVGVGLVGDQRADDRRARRGGGRVLHEPAPRTVTHDCPPVVEFDCDSDY